MKSAAGTASPCVYRKFDSPGNRSDSRGGHCLRKPHLPDIGLPSSASRAGTTTLFKPIFCGIEFSVHTGSLSGRSLVSYGYPNRFSFDDHQAQQDSYDATQTVALDALPLALPELVFAILSPLYELFDFFQLSKRFVEKELASLLKNQF